MSRIERACAHCGKAFTLYASQATRGRGRYCSVTCGVRANGGVAENRACVVCGASFRAKGSAIAKGAAVTCSRKCRVRHVATKAQRPRTRSCHACGKQFIASQRKQQARRFCSRSCFQQWHRGDRVANWQGGVASDADYSRLAAAKRRAAAFGVPVSIGVTRAEWKAICAAFGFRCPSCGRHEAEIGRLTMDHIVPLSRGGLHHRSNVQPLCQSCNSRKSQRAIGFAPDGHAVEVTNIKALLAAILSGEAPLTFVSLNYDVLDQLASAGNGTLTLPGIEAYEETGTRAKPGRRF